MLRRLLGAVVLGSCLALTGLPVDAASPLTCSEGATPIGTRCVITATSPGEGGTTSTSKGTATSSAACHVGYAPVPCHHAELGWWSNARNCYVKAVSPPPPAGDPVWGGRADGAIYQCVVVPGLGTLPASYYQFWAASAPAGPDPRVLAQQAVASMNLQPIAIGIVPEDRPDAVGLVGLPTWLWVENPGAQTWGPITRSASAGGVTVTATARVQSIRWLMGDGGVVSCAGPGTAYEDRYGTAESPTCGYRYPKQGTYRVQAESSWLVTWSGMGQSGTIPLSLTSSTQITIGELQVLTQGRG